MLEKEFKTIKYLINNVEYIIHIKEKENNFIELNIQKSDEDNIIFIEETNSVLINELEKYIKDNILEWIDIHYNNIRKRTIWI